jgi:predicted exporter
MTRAALAGTLAWALLVLTAAVIVTRATYTADLSAFLPRRANATQRLLVEQLREGPAAHLIVAAIEGSDAPTRARVSAELAARLRSDPAFLAVNNGDAAQLERDRQFLFEHRYVLSTAVTAARFTVSGLRAAISDSLDALASPEGLLLKPLFTRDASGEMLGIVESLDESHAPHLSDGVWSSPDGARALLIAQTRGAGSDTDAQQAACEALRRAFAAAVAALPPAQRDALQLRMSGPPVFAVAARATIKREVLRLSAISGVLITALLLAVYRSLPVLALTLVPVASGALAGVAAVALGFHAVHGITLGFGITLIGEAVDYSIYLFIQRAADFRRSVWPTIRLGVLTSICGFAALLPSSFTGLAQLGLYSIAGLTAAALVTRFVLPGWLPRRLAIRDLSSVGAWLAGVVVRLRPLRGALLLVPLLAGVALYLHRGALWSRELSALSPIPLADQKLYERLRGDVGAPDTRYVVVASGADRESALAAAEGVSQRLAPLVERGVLGGFESPSRFLPSLTAQQARRASLPPPAELRARLAQALQGLPVSAGKLEPFVLDVERARTAPALTRADLGGTSLAAAVDALLVRSGAGWSALLPLSAPGSADLPDSAVAQVHAVLAGAAARADLLDLKGEADRLYAGYLTEAAQLALAGLGAIVLLLAVTLRSPARVARVVLPLALSVLAVAGVLVAFGRELTILHIVGMLLIIAVGSNYALFFDRAALRPQQGSVALTLASLAVANLATVVAFGVLACSSVPVLSDLGSTVAPGTLLALLFAALLARPLPAAPPHATAPLPSRTARVTDPT